MFGTSLSVRLCVGFQEDFEGREAIGVGPAADPSDPVGCDPFCFILGWTTVNKREVCKSSTFRSFQKQPFFARFIKTLGREEL